MDTQSIKLQDIKFPEQWQHTGVDLACTVMFYGCMQGDNPVAVYL